MFTRHTRPHHVQHPDHGWLTHEHADLLPDLRGRIDHADFVGGPPELEHPHWVEVDISSQLHGYTRLTPEEIAARAQEAEAYHKAQAILEAKAKKDRDLIRGRAKDDPAFAALARSIGIPLD